MAERLTQDDINTLAVGIARDVIGADLVDLYREDSSVQREIHLGAVVSKDAMLADYEADVVRTVPEDVDS